MALTPEQLALRQSGYGASEVATLVGRGPGKLIDIFEEKVYGPKPEEEPDDEGLAKRLGLAMEAPTADEYALRTKSHLAPVYTLRHPSKELALATPDRARFLTPEARARALTLAQTRGLVPPGLLDMEALLEADRLVEVKTTGSRYRREYGAPGSAVVPDEKAIQVTWQMGVTGARVVDMPVLFRGEWGLKFEIFTVPFNETLFEGLYEAVERFHVDHVLARKPPPPDGTDRYDEFLKRAFPTHRVPPIIAGPDEEALMLRFAKLCEAESRLKKARKRARQELVELIGDAGGLVSSSYGTLTYRRSADGAEVDWEKAANEFQMLAALCIEAFEPSENRTLLEERLKAIIPEATQVKHGYRSLRPTWRGEAALELMRLSMALDPIDSDTKSEPGVTNAVPRSQENDDDL